MVAWWLGQTGEDVWEQDEAMMAEFGQGVLDFHMPTSADIVHFQVSTLSVSHQQEYDVFGIYDSKPDCIGMGYELHIICSAGFNLHQFHLKMYLIEID